MAATTVNRTLQMPKHDNRAMAKSNRSARRASQSESQVRRSELLGRILEESSSIALNDGANQKSARQALDNHAKLFELIEELKQVESPCNPKLPERNEESWKKFSIWFNDNLEPNDKTNFFESIDISKLNSKCANNETDDQEYALFAKSPISRGQEIFAIPRKVMLSTDTVNEDSELSEFIQRDSIASSMQNVVLVLHLLNEYSKGNQSRWYPYLAILPCKLLPVLSLTKEKLQCMLVSSHLFEALKMIRAIARQYSYFFKCLQATNLPLSKDFTFEYYSWGVSVVCSRQNEIPPFDRQSMPVVHALIPVLDMCNHDRLSNQATFEDNQSKLLASKDLSTDDEITINYGTRSSGDFYIHNGFVPKEVPFDIVPLNISLDRNEVLFEKKARLLKTLNMPISGRFRLTLNDYENRHRRDPHLTMFLIVYFLSEDELELILNSDNPVGKADEIYEYVQYHDKEICINQQQTVDEMTSPKTECNPMLIRLSKCNKEYLSRRASIGIALIDRALQDHKVSDHHLVTMLEHEKDIYRSHLINSTTN